MRLITASPRQVADIIEGKTPRNWYIAIGITSMITLMLGAMLAYLVATGIGVWGNNAPVFWGWDITNFVFWIGIGHAGTLISAILFLFRQKWRTSINRAAEAMTLFAVVCAGIFPLFHTGPSVARRLLAVPDPEHGSAAVAELPQSADVGRVRRFALTPRYRRCSGMSAWCPDLATLRDRAKNRIRQIVFGALSLGWRGSARNWRHYETAYLILAGLSTPLVLSVHSVVSFDFATSVIPGWHTTIFPPYFVAGAIFSRIRHGDDAAGVARWALGLQNLITMKHLENMNKVMLATGTIVGYAYATEFFIALYSGNPVRTVHVHQPRVRAVRLGLLDDVLVQRHLAAVLLVQAAAHQYPGHVRVVDLHQHRHVV